VRAVTPWWGRLRRALRVPPAVDWHAEATRQAEQRCAAEAEADSLREALQRAVVALRYAEELLRAATEAASVHLGKRP